MATYRVYWTTRGFRVQGLTPAGADASSFLATIDEFVDFLDAAAGLELGFHGGQEALIAHHGDDRFVVTGPCFIGLYLGLSRRPEHARADVPLVVQRRLRQRAVKEEGEKEVIRQESRVPADAAIE